MVLSRLFEERSCDFTTMVLSRLFKGRSSGFTTMFLFRLLKKDRVILQRWPFSRLKRKKDRLVLQTIVAF